MTAPAPQPQATPCDVLYAVHVAVLRALEVAGRRLVTGRRRERADLQRIQAAAPYTLHTELPVPVDDLDRLLGGAWRLLDVALPDQSAVLTPVVDDYARDLLRMGVPHHLDMLRAALTRAGVTL